MTDLLILYILLNNKTSIYGLKKELDSKYSNFFNVSLGAIHPCIKRLEDNELITTSKQISSGGQRKSTFSITEKGVKHFNELISAELPNHPANAEQLINLKLLALDSLDEKQKLNILKEITKHYEKLKFNTQNILNKAEITEHHAHLLKQELRLIENKIDRITTLSR